MAGKKIRCNGCGAGVWVPKGEATSSAQPSRHSIKPLGDNDDATASSRPVRDRAIQAEVPPVIDDEAGETSSLLDELASIEGGKRRKRAEPVLPSRSTAMEEVRQKVAEQEAVEAQKKVAKAKKKKKKSSGYFDPKDTLTLVGGVAAFVALLTFLAWGYPDLRFPLGGLLCVLGFIVYTLGAFSLRQLVAEEGALKALLFRFCPPYQLWFVATHWEDAKDFVAFFAAGFVILTLGGAVIKTSEIGKKAAESERSYQEIRQGGRVQAPPSPANDIASDGN
jgi:hypothetical protein